jgi:hypothetical protein
MLEWAAATQLVQEKFLKILSPQRERFGCGSRPLAHN